MITCGGRRLPAVNSISNGMFKRNENREKTYASIDEIHSVRSTPGTATISVLTKNRGRSPTVHAVTKLSRLRCLGQDTAPSAITSPYGRRAVITVHRIGKSQ